MRVTFPHMGPIWICLEGMLQYLGIDVVVPPFITKKTLQLGSQHAPEFACLPFKLNLGNFIEAATLGADTILMAGGCGPCRFGYYAQVEHEILKELGYKYELLALNPPQKNIGELFTKIKYLTGNQSWLNIVRGILFGFHKALAVDLAERESFQKRPREKTPGSTDKALEESIREIIQAKDPAALKKAIYRSKEIMSAVAITNKPVIKVGLVGEIYTLLEPFTSQSIEKRLGTMGFEVERSVYLSQWISDHLFKGLVKGVNSNKEYLRLSTAYLKHTVGGHGQETIGSIMDFTAKGVQGIIQVFPFTCMPEIVAHSILPKMSKDLNIPMMTIIVDEQSGEAGLVTRLEAFGDLLQERNEAKENLA